MYIGTLVHIIHPSCIYNLHAAFQVYILLQPSAIILFIDMQTLVCSFFIWKWIERLHIMIMVCEADEIRRGLCLTKSNL